MSFGDTSISFYDLKYLGRLYMCWHMRANSKHTQPACVLSTFNSLFLFPSLSLSPPSLALSVCQPDTQTVTVCAFRGSKCVHLFLLTLFLPHTLRLLSPRAEPCVCLGRLADDLNGGISNGRSVRVGRMCSMQQRLIQLA